MEFIYTDNSNLKNNEIMGDVLLFIVLLIVGVAFYRLFYASIKWFEKI